MLRYRFWLSLLTALLLTACGTVPLSPNASGHGSTSPYTLQSPKRSGTALIPSGPLSTLSVASNPSNGNYAVTSIAAPKDLWERMRRGFIMPDLDSDLVRDREQWYANRPEYMQRMAERSSKYLFHIVEELERRNMPQELALLPFIESAFNPQAVSSAKAAGMWQFMPATGRDYDLKQNAFRDDRRDVLASTRAALDYLERLYAMFGDWHLALAAYNWGEGNVSRAIKRNQAIGLPTGYLDLRMPEETRYYVPKLQAVKNIVQDPRRFRTALPSIGNHPFFDTVTLQRDMDVSVIAQLADVQEKDFRQLNPSHNKPVVLAAGTPTILLPWDNAHLFEERLKSHKGPLASWTAWTVPRTMSAAAAAKEHDIGEQELREINKIPPRMQLRAGSTLLVPRNGKKADVPEHIADNGQILLTPEIRIKTVKVKAKAGDTLAKLAKRHKVSVTDLSRWNDLSASAKLKNGQVLLLQRAVTPGKKNTAAKGKPRAKSAATAKPRNKTKSQQPVRGKKRPT